MGVVFLNLRTHKLTLLKPDIEKKKSTAEEISRLNEIEDSIHHFMETSIEKMNIHFTPLRKSVSPMTSKLQVHVDAFVKKEKEHRKVAEYGFVNYNLCLNAQTTEKHTECDASYTIISVPFQLKKKVNLVRKNQGKFEMNINKNCTFVIAMDVGTCFTYSGFLFTHRQQIHMLTEHANPFINIVSCNSKRLFENTLQSFRRYLGNKF